MNNVFQFKKRKDETDGDCDDPIDIIFTNLLFDLREHGYWEPSENDAVNENMCLMFESIQSYMNKVDKLDHPFQQLAQAIDNKQSVVVVKKG
jgi:hypothetical protein